MLQFISLVGLSVSMFIIEYCLTTSELGIECLFAYSQLISAVFDSDTVLVGC